MACRLRPGDDDSISSSMRPPVLNPLFAPLSALPGVGPKLEKAVRAAHRPRRRRAAAHHRPVVPPACRLRRPARPPKLSQVTPDTVVTVAVTIDRHRPPPPNRPRLPYKIDASDDTSTLTITYFNARKGYLEKLLPEGELRYVSGMATLYDGHLQMLHPGTRRGRQGLCVAAADRPGLSADRRAASEPAPQSAGRGAAPHSRAARMAGRGLAGARGFSGLCRRARAGASSGEARRSSSRTAKPVAARL